ncbi:hypothetical protein BJY04DRAFT_210965 [Aspergillus karnatakaensis]|uniref:GMC family oxidoreductase n=1 Tax=Aspergillus karnatakaensis TaxID=1810916 RepID=UPI003CCD432B
MARLALLLQLFASLAAASLALNRQPAHDGHNATFDYVVVGGGTSGLALAARLAEDSNISVAVVEAGGYYEKEGTVESIIPAFALMANTSIDPSQTSPIDWDFKAEPLTQANDRVVRYARGKTLGGSSARNFMAYHRGTKGTYDQWAELTGDPSWGWDSVNTYFKKSCTLTAPNMMYRHPNTTVTYNPEACDVSGGPLQVTWPNYGAPSSTWFELGLDSIGVPPVSDFNSGFLNGSAWAATTIRPHEQIRDSSETSYLQSALQRKNTTLKIYKHTLALQINFDGTTATGVQVKSTLSGKKYTLHARREVILSAGAFQSPQLLMVSGIGPRATLEAHGIPVLYDSPPVGQNMWDHIYFTIAHQVNVETPTRLDTDPAYAYESALEYAARRDGPLSSPPFGLLAWERLSATHLPHSTLAELDSTFPPDWPTIEYISTAALLDAAPLANATENGAQYAAIGAALVAPLSRGQVTIRSASMEDPPIIELGYLTHKADVDVALAAFKRTRDAWSATEITVGSEYQPGPAVQTDEEILTYLRSNIGPVYHPAGTCAMGKNGDAKAVVDSAARVIGVHGLRVVDASIFPTLPPGHPQSSCYMIAEKIAAQIRNNA